MRQGVVGTTSVGRSGNRAIRTLNARVVMTAASLALLATACVQTPEPPREAEIVYEYDRPLLGELIEIEYLLPGHETPEIIVVEQLDGWLIWESDMVIGHVDDLVHDGSVGPLAHTHKSIGKRWPRVGGDSATAPYRYQVPYTISDDFDDDPGYPELILDAIEHWEANSNLVFVPRTDHDDYIQFREVTGRCNSMVGMRGGRQRINLDPNLCLNGLIAGVSSPHGIIVHEIGHAVGMFHEQQRGDRDDHITIIKQNVDLSGPRFRTNFGRTGVGHGPAAYDFGSIMHYGAKAFGKVVGGTQLTTIVTIPPGQTIGQRFGLSNGDVAAIARMYPAHDLPSLVIGSPVPNSSGTVRVPEGVVTLTADVTVSIHAEDAYGADHTVAWSYLPAGATSDVPLGVVDSGAAIDHTFCDGEYELWAATQVRVSASNTLTILESLPLVVQQPHGAPPAECAWTVDITRPSDNVSLSLDQWFALEAEVDNEHGDADPQPAEVVWTVLTGGSGTPREIAIGLSAEISALGLGVGTHTITVTYGSATDSITVTVGETPELRITNPAYGATVLEGFPVFVGTEFNRSLEPDLEMNLVARRLGSTDDILPSSGSEGENRFNFPECGTYVIEASVTHKNPLPVPGAGAPVHRDSVLVYVNEFRLPTEPDFPPPCKAAKWIDEPTDLSQHPVGEVNLSATKPAPAVPIGPHDPNPCVGDTGLPVTCRWHIVNPETGQANPLPGLEQYELRDSYEFTTPRVVTLHLYIGGQPVDGVRFTVTGDQLPPQVRITSPPNGIEYHWTDYPDVSIPVTFTALAQNGSGAVLPDSAVIWELDCEGWEQRGTGASTTITFTPGVCFTGPGRNTVDVRVTATDPGNGLSVSDTIRFEITWPES